MNILSESVSIPSILEIFLILSLVPFGMIAGSFCTALVHRIPKGMPWAFQREAARSKCPVCATPLTVLDLIPVFSWLFLRGKCRHCGAPISPRYLLIEISMPMLFVIVGLTQGVSWEVLPLFLALPFLLALFVIDLDHLILPDQLVIVLGGFAVLQTGLSVFLLGEPLFAAALQLGLGAAIFGAVSYGLRWFMSAILKKEAMGLGDVKFFIVAGAWLGVMALPNFLLLSGLFGLFFGLFWKLVLKQDVFPFGPALIMSLFALLVFDLKTSFLTL